MKIFDLDRLLDTLTSYIETKLELFKIEIKEEINAVVARVVIGLMVAAFFSIAVIFGLMALAGWLNTLLESEYLGYLIVCGLLLLITVLIYSQRSGLQKRILGKIAESQEETTDE